MKKSNANKCIPYGHQCIDDSDIEEVIKVLKSDWITQGPKIKEFEKLICQYTGANYCIVVSSGTAALHLATLSSGVRQRDEVITSPNTFLATANCIIYAGGTPRFADIDPHTNNIDPKKIKGLIRMDPSRKKIKGIIPVHFAGLPSEMETIKSIADEYDLFVIEDGCHALGSEWQDSKGRWHKVGSCSHSNITVFSFHAVKHITTGEGGAITTNNKNLYEKLLRLRNHGMTKDPDLLRRNDAPWYYEMHELGYNYRITDFQCALGISQMKKLDSFIERRNIIAEKFNDEFNNIEEISIPFVTEKNKCSYHLYVIKINFPKIEKTRIEVINELKSNGIGTQVHYIPIHLQPYYQEKLGCKKGDFPIAEDYYERALTLPLFPKMSDEDVEDIINGVKKFIGA